MKTEYMTPRNRSENNINFYGYLKWAGLVLSV